MIKLRPDLYSRQGGIARRVGARQGLLSALVFLSIALLVLSRLQHGYITELRLQMAELMAPALKAALVPLEPVRRVGQRVSAYFEMFNELERLRDENQKLRGWEWRARETERKFVQLGRLANVVEEPGLPFITARVVADSSGPFLRSAMLGAGGRHGLKAGYPAVDANGLVGRILETGEEAARLLLVTDINSRVPVLVGGDAIRAVLTGDNGPAPRLMYLPSEARVAVGDEVYTSGVGGLYPRGLRIGAVIDDGPRLRVSPHARLDNLEYVSVLLYDSPTLSLADDVRPLRGRDAAARNTGVPKLPVEPMSRVP